MIALLLGLALALDCAELDGGLADGFATVNPRPGDLGSGHRVCPRDELAGAIPAAAAIDAEDFYGLLSGGLAADGSWVVSDRATLFGGVELVRYDTLISAFTDSALGTGHTWVGGSVFLAESDRARAAVDGRLVLPTAFALYRHAWPFALDLGAAGHVGNAAIRGHGRIGVLHSFAVSLGPPAPWIGGSLRAGAELRPGDHFALVLDLDGTLGYDGSKLAAVPELRFAIGRKLGLSLGGWVPVVSPTRQPLGIELRASGRLSEG